MKSDLKVSIITVCLNSGNIIEKTILSVISQTYSNIEYIIVDGKSTDCTLDIIHKYRLNVDVFVSEEDKGIYDAMNKGAKLATGDIFYFLNSGDLFYDEKVVEGITTSFVENEGIDLIYGYYGFYDDKGVEQIATKRQSNIEIIAEGINHQSIFARKRVFEKCGFFDISYKLYADYDWLLRALIKYNQQVMYLDIPIAYYLKGGFSDKYYRLFRFERFDISMKYLNPIMFLKYLVLYPKSIKQDLKIKIFKTFKLRDFNKSNKVD